MGSRVLIQDEGQDARLNIAVISLFPEMFGALTDFGISSRAAEECRYALKVFNPRDFATDKHRTVDDRPYGGGPGMVMKVQPLEDALDAARMWLATVNPRNETVLVIYMSPQGRVLTRSVVSGLEPRKNIIVIAGRYEGIDERFLEQYVDEEISIGDYVLSGGELPAMVLMDALIRRLPGVLGDAQSAEQDSFENGLLDCPHYTRPEVLNGVAVPEVLLSGNHQRIADWRLQQSLGRTKERRPELLEKLTLSPAQQVLLKAYFDE